MSLSELKARPDLGCCATTCKPYRQRMTVLAMEDAAQRTTQLLADRSALAEGKRQRRREIRGIAAEGAIVIDAEADVGDMKVGGTSGGDTHENVTDFSGESSDTVTVGKALHDLPDGGSTMHSLENFFERPFSIYDDTWALGVEHNVNLAIWDLWSKKPAIRAKLSNYAYFRGNLHVKIAISSTPYHYGRILASYQPYPGFNQSLLQYDNLLTGIAPAPADVLPLYKSYLSQAPGARVMDIKENKPLEIEVPFISYKQKFRLFNDSTSVITNAISFYDFAEAGELRLSSLTGFLSANDDYASAVSVNVFVWATDVELGTITGTNVDITAESALVIDAEARGSRSSGSSKTSARRAAKDIERKAEQLEDDLEDDESWGGRFSREQDERQSNWNKSMENKPMYSGKGNFGSRFMDSLEKGGQDEYSEPGPVGTVATAVGRAGEALSDIPVIGGFAKATSTIAKGIGKVASWFGWSKPVVLDKPAFVKNQPFTNGANLEGHETALRITCDPKQELSVDPSLGGMSNDELTILSIASRESYIGSFDWSDANVAMTDVLWKSGVTPFLGQRLTTSFTGGGASPNYGQDSAMCFATRPFKFWRGTIKFRFEIVCSKFHRGKLLFRYEPNLRQYGLIASSGAQLNQQNTTILDIQDGQTITFECDWAQTRAWAHTPFAAQSDFGMPTRHYVNDTPLTNSAYSFDPSFHYANEFNGIIECRVLNELVQPTASSGVVVNVYAWCEDLQVAMPTYRNLPKTRIIDAQSAIVQEEDDSSAKLVKTDAAMDNLHLEHFGEKILSLRSLLKRYQTTRAYTHNVAVGTGAGYWHLREDNIPSGMVPGTGIPIPQPGMVERNLFTYMRHAFMGMRGSMKHRLTLMGDSLPNSHCYTKVTTTEADPKSASTNGLSFIDSSTISAILDDRSNAFINSILGTVDFHVNSNGGIEFEVPFYSPNLFMFAFDNDGGEGVGADDDFGYDPYFPHKWVANIATNEVVNGNTMHVLDSVAIGEDFQFFRFMGAPPLTPL